MKKAKVPEKSVLTNWFSLFNAEDKEEEEGDEEEEDEEEEEQEEEKSTQATPQRKGRGRPRQTPKASPAPETPKGSEDQPKRGRGRPRKNQDEAATPGVKKDAPTPKVKKEVVVMEEVVSSEETPGRTRRGTRVTDLRTKLEESPGTERKSTRKKTTFTCDDCKETFQMEYLLLVHKKRCKRESLLMSPPKSARKTPAKTGGSQKKATPVVKQSTAVGKSEVGKQSKEGEVEQKKNLVEMEESTAPATIVVVSGSSTVVYTENIGEMVDEGLVAAEVLMEQSGDVETSGNVEKSGEGVQAAEGMEVDQEKTEGVNDVASQTEKSVKEEEPVEEVEEEEDVEEDDGGEWRPSHSDSPPAKRRRGRGPSRRALAMIQDDADDDEEEYKGMKRKRKILLNMKQAIKVLNLTPKRKPEPQSEQIPVNTQDEISEAAAAIMKATEENQSTTETQGEGTEETATEKVVESQQEVSEAGEGNQEEEQEAAEDAAKTKEEKAPLKVVLESIPSDEERDLSEADYLDVAEIEKMVDLSSSDCAICGMHFKVYLSPVIILYVTYAIELCFHIWQNVSPCLK